LSFALPIPINLTNGIYMDERAAIGITGKYHMGHALAIAQDDGSAITTTDIVLRFPVIAPDSSYSGKTPLGTGTGADIALAWSGGPWRVGLLAENVFNSFKWDTTQLAFLPGTGTFNVTTQTTDFEQRPYGGAPQALKAVVETQRIKPAIAIGGALKVMPSLTLTADVKTHMGGEEAIVIGPKSRFGLGAEWRVLPFIPLRAGVASVTDGWQAGAGFGLSFLGYELGISSSIRRRGQASESGVMFGLVGIGR
jgi:hypothetical protein